MNAKIQAKLKTIGNVNLVSQDIFPLVVFGFTEYPFFISDGTEKLIVLSLYSFFSEVNSDK